jgi:hypothetical protein
MCHLIFISGQLILDPRQFDLAAHHAEEIELATSLTGSVENLQIFGIGNFESRWFNSFLKGL